MSTQSLASPDAALVNYRSRTFGARNLAALWDGWRKIVAIDSVQELLLESVGESFGLVRILYFDKPPGHGWSLPWHRDQTIAVKRHLDPLNPFGKATTKAGVPHVEATREVLDRMLTLRLSIDPMNENNGPLLVIPGSHDDANIEERYAVARPAIELHCDAGDIFAMRPRILHASKSASGSSDTHRRVVHMEFAPSNILPGSWKWHSFDAVSAYDNFQEQ